MGVAATLSESSEWTLHRLVAERPSFFFGSAEEENVPDRYDPYHFVKGQSFLCPCVWLPTRIIAGQKTCLCMVKVNICFM